MEAAFAEAEKALKINEVPVGAVVTCPKKGIIGRGFNLSEAGKNALNHAEIIAISEACQKLDSKNLSECSIFITLEPCFMCAAAISFARIKNVHFANFDEKSGGLDFFKHSSCHHKPEIYSPNFGSQDSEKSRKMLESFFQNLRLNSLN